MIRPLFLFVFSASLIGSFEAFGAACCGGGIAVPSIIVNDDRAKFSVTYSYLNITDDVDSSNVWDKRDTREANETFKFEAAHIFNDLWQAGISAPIVKRSRADESSTGLGDLALTLGYEYLPEWDYNPWRPRGHGYLSLIAPTGRSVNESDTLYGLDSRGRGFWAIGVGTILTKIRGRWDYFSTLDVHRSFDKSYSHNDSHGTLKPGWGGSFGLGAGFNKKQNRFGGSVAWTYEDPVDVTGTVHSSGKLQRFATAALSGSRMINEDLSATITYSDQTLIGSPSNTSLGRGIMLLVQRRWLR